jgi:hypothetical protein
MEDLLTKYRLIVTLSLTAVWVGSASCTFDLNRFSSKNDRVSDGTIADLLKRETQGHDRALVADQLLGADQSLKDTWGSDKRVLDTSTLDASTLDALTLDARLHPDMPPQNCDPISCPQGCCDGDTCLTWGQQNIGKCGAKAQPGEACQPCIQDNDLCTDEICKDGYCQYPFAVTLEGISCTVNGLSGKCYALHGGCCTGCWDGVNTCKAGTEHAFCGKDGNICSTDCANCNNGICTK